MLLIVYFFHRRKYFLFELVKNILDGMSFVKLNVLHMHILDWCRLVCRANCDYSKYS